MQHHKSTLVEGIFIWEGVFSIYEIALMKSFEFSGNSKQSWCKIVRQLEKSMPSYVSSCEKQDK